MTDKYLLISKVNFFRISTNGLDRSTIFEMSCLFTKWHVQLKQCWKKCLAGSNFLSVFQLGYRFIFWTTDKAVFTNVVSSLYLCSHNALWKDWAGFKTRTVEIDQRLITETWLYHKATINWGFKKGFFILLAWLYASLY